MYWKSIKKKKPKFNLGEIIWIKSEDEIRQILDSNNKLDGCLFMENMWEYCGEKAKIIKIVKNFWNNDRMLSSKIPIYMLENTRCNGNVYLPKYRCDRNCFFLWHEKWISKT